MISQTNVDVIKYELQLLLEVSKGGGTNRNPHSAESFQQPSELLVEHATCDGVRGYLLVLSSNGYQGFVSIEDAQQIILRDVAFIEKALYERAGQRPFIRRPYHGDIEKFGHPVDGFLVEAGAPGTFRRTPIIIFSWPDDDVFFTTDASAIQRAIRTNAEILSGRARVAEVGRDIPRA